LLLIGALFLGGAGCATMGLRAAVSLRLSAPPEAPRDALVYVDGQFVGNLATVVARGVRLPEGPHRLRVEKTGYHPWSREVVSDRKDLLEQVELLRLPD